MGRFYARIAQATVWKKLAILFKEPGFAAKKALFADRKAVTHLRKAIELADEMGAGDTSGRANLVLGMLHKAKGRHDQARECLSTALHIFEDCEAGTDFKNAKEALESLSRKGNTHED
jgi:tetratricopeptide (TPR) repeat protein